MYKLIEKMRKLNYSDEFICKVLNISNDMIEELKNNTWQNRKRVVKY